MKASGAAGEASSLAMASSSAPTECSKRWRRRTTTSSGGVGAKRSGLPAMARAAPSATSWRSTRYTAERGIRARMLTS